jgi:trans-aconitate 2-methyltransferase
MARTAAIWDPTQYLRFAGERMRPALDLLAQVPLDAPARVVDLGCGPGTVTAILRQRFPQAEVVGVDGSATMLEKARATVPQCRFEQADFFQWQPAEPFDLIYSNAALHWVDRHSALFPRLLSLLAPGGVLAVQMPAMHDTPLRRIPLDLAGTEPWTAYLGDVSSAPGILSPTEYWDLLRPHVASLDLWQTTYVHALSGENAVAEWAAACDPSWTDCRRSGRKRSAKRMPMPRDRTIPAGLTAPRYCPSTGCSWWRARGDVAGDRKSR